MANEFDTEAAVRELAQRVLPEEQVGDFFSRHGGEEATDPGDYNVRDFADYVQDVDDPAELNRLEKAEEEGKNRAGVLASIQDRRTELEA